MSVSNIHPSCGARVYGYAPTAAQVKLVRRTVAKSCTDAEFEEFIEIARLSGLDPLRRQIAPLIVSAHEPDMRRLIPWTTIDGLRLIAARQGNYRPMETAPVIDFDASRISDAVNPLGIVRAEVRAWRHDGAAWHPVAGEAWWDEYAPLRPNPAPERSTSSVAALDVFWRRMGRVCIAKCAEAQALRRGWPDVLSGLYGEEELHRLRRSEADLSAAAGKSAKHAEKPGSRAICLEFDQRAGMERVPLAAAQLRLCDHYARARSVGELDEFAYRNQASLSEYWMLRASDALACKQAFERRRAELLRCKAAESALAAHLEHRDQVGQGHETTSASAGGANLSETAVSVAKSKHIESTKLSMSGMQRGSRRRRVRSRRSFRARRGKRSR
ncbi:MAG: phage recombination protein Bet [Hyphomonadaceae bacterium]